MLDPKYLAAVETEVAVILRAEREKKGLSMNVVAERAGLSQPMVSLVERELRKPTLDTLLRITMALGVDVVEVLRRARQTAGRRTK